jgi:hypothetical protein
MLAAAPFLPVTGQNDLCPASIDFFLRPSEIEVPMKRHAYGWLTAAFFIVSIVGHWTWGWFAFVDEQTAHGQAPHLAPYLFEMGRDTLENWQSEFLQLLWQVVGLAYFLYVGSPASKKTASARKQRWTRFLSW